VARRQHDATHPVLERDRLHVAGGVDEAEPGPVRRQGEHEDCGGRRQDRQRDGSGDDEQAGTQDDRAVEAWGEPLGHQRADTGEQHHHQQQA
jgi:hypothetical protein